MDTRNSNHHGLIRCPFSGDRMTQTAKKQLEYITALPTLDSEEDAHYVVACETYMVEEAQNLEEW